jgi:hypothetical protein
MYLVAVPRYPTPSSLPDGPGATARIGRHCG